MKLKFFTVAFSTVSAHNPRVRARSDPVDYSDFDDSDLNSRWARAPTDHYADLIKKWNEEELQNKVSSFH